MIVGGTLLFLVLIAVMPHSAPKPPAQPQVQTIQKVEERATPQLLPGSEAVVEVPGSQFVALATDAGWDAMLDAENRKDVEELSILIARGQVFATANGTRAKVLSTGITSMKVRLREGPNTGVEAWIQREFVKPYEEEEPPDVVAKPETPKKPAPRTLTDEDRAVSAYNVGRNLEKSGRSSEALKAYKDLLERYPSAPAAKEAAGRIEALSKK